ncbi:MAG: CoA transferase [Proteobacteria bacterium]|nr:CoA transferase [Pseudomonadota bacterium]
MAMALEGIKVLDVSQVAAVPMCARHLADYGAEVVHIENATTGDSWRYLQAGAGGGPAGVESEIPYNWEAFNRNKKSVAIDLSKKTGREILYKLAEDADVFLTNLRLYERKKFEVDFEDIIRLNPRIVYGSVTGHGKKGAEKETPAYDTTVYFVRAGVNEMLTIPGMSGPSPRPAFGDTLAGLGLAFGVMTALFAREKTGEGQEVDTSLLASGIYQLSFDMASALTTRQDEAEYRRQLFDGTEEEKRLRDELVLEAQTALGRLSGFYRERLPNPMANSYETKDGRQIRFNALHADRYWDKFCRLLGLEELEHDPKYATMEARFENRKELYHIFKKAFLQKTLAEWRPHFMDLPWAPIQNLVELADDPQARTNGYFLPYDHPTYGQMEILGSPVNLSKTPATIRQPAPEFGQHTEEVLLDAGFEWEEIERFKEEGVIPE